jgi:hypothetical protein
MYRLKKGKESFTVVEGAFKGRTFKPDETYAEIPPQFAGSFVEVKKTSAPAPAPYAKKTEKPKEPERDDSKKQGAAPASEEGGKK